MKSPLIGALLFIVGLGIGVGIMFALADPEPTKIGEDDAPAKSLQVKAETEKTTKKRPTPKHESKAKPEKITDASTPGENDGSFSASLKERLDEAEVAPIEGSITGVAKDLSGNLLSGVTIYATPNLPNPSSYRQAYVQDGSAPIRPWQRKKEPEMYAHIRMVFKETTTDAQGRFTIDGLLDCQYSVEAYLKGYVSGRYGNSQKARVGDSMTFTFSKFTMMEVNIANADGSVPESANVTISTPNRGYGRGFSPSYASSSIPNWGAENRMVRYNPGVLQIQAFSIDRKMQSKRINFLAPSTTKAYRVDLVLEPITAVEIEIVGKAPERASVYLTKLSDGENLTARQIEEIGKRVTSYNGKPNTMVRDMVEGEYIAHLYINRGIVSNQRLSVRKGETTKITLDAPAPKREDYLVLWLEGIDPLQRKNVSITVGTRSKESGSRASGVSVEHQEDGSIHVPHAENEEMKGDLVYFLRVSLDRRDSIEREYERTAASSLTIKIPEPCYVRVRIEGFNQGSLPKDASIGLTKYVAPKEGSRSRRTSSFGRGQSVSSLVDEHGVLILQANAPGEYTLTLTSDHGYRSPRSTRVITLAEGENEASIAFPVIYKMRIELPAGENGRTLRATLYKDGNPMDSERADKTTNIVDFGERAAGEYRLEVGFGRNKKVMTFTLGSHELIPFAETE